MFKKLKEGDIVTIRGKRYIVTKTYSAKVKCCMCMKHNKELPCAPAGQVNDSVWNRKKCLEIVRAKYYLKPHEESDKKSGE